MYSELQVADCWPHELNVLLHPYFKGLFEALILKRVLYDLVSMHVCVDTAK